MHMTKPYKYLTRTMSFHFSGCQSHFLLFSFPIYPLPCAHHLHFPSDILIDGCLRELLFYNCIYQNDCGHYAPLWNYLYQIILISSSIDASYCYIHTLFLTLRLDDIWWGFKSLRGPATSPSNMDKIREVCLTKRLDFVHSNTDRLQSFYYLFILG